VAVLVRLIYRSLATLLSWLALLARSSVSKDAEILVLRSKYLLASSGCNEERPPDVMTGFRSQDSRRTFVAKGNGLTCGDRNRNRKLEALREVVRHGRAVLAIDLGEDKQVAAVMDHEAGSWPARS
jgi:hypothetical protein